jgi:hypothetical protein
MKNAKVLSLVLLIVMSMVLACGGGEPAPREFQGNWRGSDGSTIYMTEDGKAGFEIRGKSVDGGGAEFAADGKSFKISLFGISEVFKIDEAPKNGEMKLNGVVYKRN